MKRSNYVVPNISASLSDISPSWHSHLGRVKLYIKNKIQEKKLSKKNVPGVCDMPKESYGLEIITSLTGDSLKKVNFYEIICIFFLIFNNWWKRIKEKSYFSKNACKKTCFPDLPLSFKIWSIKDKFGTVTSFLLFPKKIYRGFNKNLPLFKRSR